MNGPVELLAVDRESSVIFRFDGALKYARKSESMEE